MFLRMKGRVARKLATSVVVLMGATSGVAFGDPRRLGG
jgi:hypothetical protein